MTGGPWYDVSAIRLSVSFSWQRRPCWVEIDTHAFEHNLRTLAAPSQAELLAIVKADAYGHSLELCAPAAVRAGARWLGVTSVEEGMAARKLCPWERSGVEILAISGAFPGQGAAAIAERVTTVIWEPWQVDELESAARTAGCVAGSVPVHLELDTGMSRQGVASAGLAAMLARFGNESPLKLDGVMTHLYAADESDGVATSEQMACLRAGAEQVQAAGQRPAWLHVGNSAFVLAEHDAALTALAQQFGMRAMMRPGLALYGIAPDVEPHETASMTGTGSELRPVLTWKTQVVSVRQISTGQVVGYNGTFVATEAMQVALLAVGYADGLRRELSNRGAVLVHGERAPIVGRISMDQTVVDVTGIEGVAAGDEVVLLGGTASGESIKAGEHAALAGTIPWEIFTSIAARVPRVPRT